MVPGPGQPDGESLEAARRQVLDRIAAACQRVGRAADLVVLVAVSKTVATDRLRQAVAAGLTRLGENRVQDAIGKASAIPEATWELVGPLQANKARPALSTFARIQTLDSVALARRLDRLAGEVSPAVHTPSWSRSTSTATRPRPVFSRPIWSAPCPSSWTRRTS